MSQHISLEAILFHLLAQNINKFWRKEKSSQQTNMNNQHKKNVLEIFFSKYTQ